MSDESFQPYVADDQKVAEFTPKAVLIGGLFGIIFGASTVYLALRAGLTVSASIPIAVLSISLLKKLGGSTILENNIVQTIGSAGESIASGVVFTLPGFLFLATGPDGLSVGAEYFSYWTIFTLALLGGMLGVLMMIPLRRALIVKEHGNLPYPEGTACASVLIAGEKGGDLAKTAYQGLGFAFLYALFQKILGVIEETPTWVSSVKSRVFPAATVAADITPEYMGVGYIIGPRIAGVLVAGGVLAWLGVIPLLASLVPPTAIALQLSKLGYLADVTKPGAFGWNPDAQEFVALNRAIYFAYVRQIGAGAVAAGGFITLIRTIPTIVSAFKGSLASLKDKEGAAATRRTEQDLPLTVVIGGSLLLILILAVLPFIPGNVLGKIATGFMIVVFGFFFVTVSSRIVGVIGTSSNPVSGMTIATLMATCLIFVGIGWTGDAYQPMALCVGGMVCIAAANAGATSQDLKTGYIVGATPRHQQVGLMIGAVAAAIVIGVTMKVLDNPTVDPATGAIRHMIGSEKFPAPQGTLMATLIKGLLAHNLDWQYVLVGVFLSITIQLCGVSALSFAVGAYLPLSTTFPIFIGGLIRGLADRKKGIASHDDDLGSGSLFSTGLVAGGSLAGVLVAFLVAGADKLKESGNTSLQKVLDSLNFHDQMHHALGADGYALLGVACFVGMGTVLYRVAQRT
jgi:OPT family oligopeptide transporter